MISPAGCPLNVTETTYVASSALRHDRLKEDVENCIIDRRQDD